jgi:hypothetical protein
MGGVAGVIVLATAFSALPAGATGSVAAVDTTTRDVGHAMASCTAWLNRGTSSLQSEIYKPVPNKGVVVGQANWFAGKQTKLAQDMAAGKTPAQLLPSRTSETLVQYLFASLNAPAAAHTGTGAGAFPVRVVNGVANPDDVKQNQVTTGALNRRFEGVAAGNTLLSKTMVRDMGAALETPTVDIVTELEKVLKFDIPPAEETQLRQNGGDLGERLMLALMVGFDDATAIPADGDARCLSGQSAYGPIKRSSSQGWVRVDGPNGQPKMNLRFESDGAYDAVHELASMYYQCRLGRISCLSDSTSGTLAKSISSKRVELKAPSGGNIQELRYESNDPHLKSATIDPRVDKVVFRFRTGPEPDVEMSLPGSGWQLVSTTGAPVWKYSDPTNAKGPISDATLDTQAGSFTAVGTRGGFNRKIYAAPLFFELQTGDQRYCSYVGEKLTNWTPNKYIEFVNSYRWPDCK